MSVQMEQHWTVTMLFLLGLKLLNVCSMFLWAVIVLFLFDRCCPFSTGRTLQSAQKEQQDVKREETAQCQAGKQHHVKARRNTITSVQK